MCLHLYAPDIYIYMCVCVCVCVCGVCLYKCISTYIEFLPNIDLRKLGNDFPLNSILYFE